MPVIVMPMRAVFPNMDESAELGWNHEYISLVPLPGRVFFAFLCKMTGIAIDNQSINIWTRGYINRRNETNGSEH